MEREVENNVWCQRDICDDLGLSEIKDLEKVPLPNDICFNMCLKSVLIHIDSLIAAHAETQRFEHSKCSEFICWKFIEEAILRPMKNRKISHFGGYALLIQICEKKLDYAIAKISFLAQNIQNDEEAQREYLSKEYQTEIIKIFDKMRYFFEEMINDESKFKPNQTIFDQMFKMGFKFTALYNEHHKMFDDLGSDPLAPFNDWLVTQMKCYGLK